MSTCRKLGFSNPDQCCDCDSRSYVSKNLVYYHEDSDLELDSDKYYNPLILDAFYTIEPSKDLVVHVPAGCKIILISTPTPTTDKGGVWVYFDSVFNTPPLSLSKNEICISNMAQHIPKLIFINDGQNPVSINIKLLRTDL